MKTTLQHLGYNGSVEYSDEDKMLHGRVLGIRDMVSYGGSSVRMLEKNFRDAVEEYLAFCKKRGKTPETPFKGSFNVRVSSDLHMRAALYAEEHDQKLNSVVQDALQHFLENVDA